MSITTVGSENIGPFSGVNFPSKDIAAPIADDFIAARDGFTSGAQGTEALDAMFAIGREAEFNLGTTSFTRQAQETLDARIRMNTDRDIRSGAMGVPVDVDLAMDSPRGWRERVKNMMRIGGRSFSLRDKMHDVISDANEKGARNSSIAIALIGTIALGAAYWNLKMDTSKPTATTAKTEAVATGQYEMQDSPVSPDFSANDGDEENSLIAVEPKTPSAEQVFHEEYSKLDDEGRGDFKGMMQWQDTYIEDNHLEKDPQRNDKALNAFVRGVRFMRSMFTKSRA